MESRGDVTTYYVTHTHPSRRTYCGATSCCHLVWDLESWDFLYNP